MRTITTSQRNTLAVVAEHGPVNPRDVNYHGFSVSEDAARASLGRLEARGLVAANYTGHHRGAGRAYTITEKGQRALDEALQ